MSDFNILLRFPQKSLRQWLLWFVMIGCWYLLIYFDHLICECSPVRHLSHKQTVVLIRPHGRLVVLRWARECLGSALDAFQKVLATIACECIQGVFGRKSMLDAFVTLYAESIHSSSLHLLYGSHQMLLALSLAELTFCSFANG
jgi:hypothetical protein